MTHKFQLRPYSSYFQEPAGIGSTRRFVAAAADLGTCPLHSHERYKLLYDKLVETARAQAAVVTPEEESDMEASDVEDEVPNVNSDSLPLGTTFRTIHILQQPPESEPKLFPASSSHPTGFFPRKLSTISSQDRESIPNIEEEVEEVKPEKSENSAKTTEAEVHAKLLNTTDFEWHPDPEESGKDPEESGKDPEESGKDPESEALLGDSSEKSPEKSRDNRAESEVIDGASALLTSKSQSVNRTGSRYKNTHV